MSYIITSRNLVYIKSLVKIILECTSLITISLLNSVKSQFRQLKYFFGCVRGYLDVHGLCWATVLNILLYCLYACLIICDYCDLSVVSTDSTLLLDYQGCSACE